MRLYDGRLLFYFARRLVQHHNRSWAVSLIDKRVINHHWDRGRTLPPPGSTIGSQMPPAAGRGSNSDAGSHLAKGPMWRKGQPGWASLRARQAICNRQSLPLIKSARSLGGATPSVRAGRLGNRRRGAQVGLKGTSNNIIIL
jgi:hypothetical protein